MKRFLAILIFTVIAFSLFSMNQALSFRLTHLSSEKGLSQQDVDCMVQDQTGFLWIGTYDGLNRFDGNEFLIYRHMPGAKNTISSNRITSIYEWPSRDELWIGTDGSGISCYNLKTEQFTSYLQESFEGERIIKALHIHDEELWIGSINGISKLTYDENGTAIITPIKIIDSRLENIKEIIITSITHDSQNNIIFSSRYGIYSKSPNESAFTLIKNDPSVLQVISDKTENIWTVSNKEICYYSVLQQQMRNYFMNPVIVTGADTGLSQFRSIVPITENLLVGITSAKVFFIRIFNNVINLEAIDFSDNYFFENNILKSVMVDNTMNVWITSALDGIAKFDLNDKIIYNYPLLKQNTPEKIFIQAIVKDNNDRLWIGSNEGCFVIDQQKNETEKIAKIDEAVFGLFKDTDGNIWCNSMNNIFYFSKGNEKQCHSIFDYPYIPSSVSGTDGPYGICEDVKNNTIWIGMRSGLLQIRKSGKNFDFYHFEKQKYGFYASHASNITTLYSDTVNNVMLIGTASDGMYEAKLNMNGDIDIITMLNSRIESRKDNHIWVLFKASDGIIYEGTDCGLNRIMRDDNGYFETDAGSEDLRLKTYKIVAIVEDNKKNLWLSTGMGLLSYNLITGEVKEFLDTDGLTSRILTEGSLYDEGTEQLFIGSIKGLNIIELSSLKFNEIAPKTVICGFNINNRPVYPNVPFNKRIIFTESLSYISSIKLKYFENNFSVNFASLHYSNPQKNGFIYKLEGLNNDWINAGNNHLANFTNLSPGKYTLWVKSCNVDGIWEKEPAKLMISITPEPWKTTGAYIIYSLLFVTILFFIYRYFANKRKFKHQLFIEQLENQKKIEISEIKLKYHTNITHELRTPLSLIVAPVEELIDKSYNDKFINSRLQSIRVNTKRLLELINQMLDFRKVITDNYTLRIKKYNLHEKLNDIKENFSTSALQKNIMFELYYDSAIDYCWCDIEIINKICYNLLSNAIKYTPGNGKIYVYVSTNADHSKITISVEDTGIGIDESEIDKIFERFYQSPDSTGGTGIGLHICKHLVILHKGNINVKSRKEQGSIFTVELPITRDAYPEDCVFEDKFVSNATIYNKDEMSTKDNTGMSEKTPLILVVEDNFELRKYIVSLLSGKAKIIEAENGETGYNLAVNNIPDLIVSDIMMPIMDGIEMTRKCKNNVFTSHIPIILLTAKDTIENEIEGLRYGADDYICKPFNPQALKLKIKNMIKLTRKNRVEDIEDENLTDRDRSFIAEFEKVIHENIAVSEFGIDNLCRIMGVSRMQLYRKTMAILNKKPSQFIKEIKMKKAFELLKVKGYNISEAMYDVGYTNYTHFSKLFTEVNGITPRKLLGMKEDQTK